MNFHLFLLLGVTASEGLNDMVLCSEISALVQQNFVHYQLMCTQKLYYTDLARADF